LDDPLGDDRGRDLPLETLIVPVGIWSNLPVRFR
jgi:hypothetical protein